MTYYLITKADEFDKKALSEVMPDVEYVVFRNSSRLELTRLHTNLRKWGEIRQTVEHLGKNARFVTLDSWRVYA